MPTHLAQSVMRRESLLPHSGIDRLTIDELRKEAGQELVDELAGLFEESVEPFLEELKEAQKAGDGALIVKASHKWKSSCRLVGAVRAAELCDLLEQHAQQGDMFGTAELIGLLEREAVLAKIGLRMHRSDREASGQTEDGSGQVEDCS